MVMKIKKNARSIAVDDIWHMLENGYLDPKDFLVDPTEVIKAIDTINLFLNKLIEKNLLE